MNKKNLLLFKKDVSAEEFLELKPVKHILKQPLQLVLGHCRQPTKGEPNFNFNNHPFVDDNLVLIHQGIIWNDDDLREEYELPEKGKTDSWVIVQLIKHFQKKQKLIDAIASTHSILRGYWACALIDKKEPDIIYLFCHEKSIVVYYLPEKNIFVFSTERDKLDDAVLNTRHHFGIFEENELPRMAEYEVEDDRCLILNNKPKLYKLPEPPTYRYYDWGKKNRWDREDKYDLYGNKKNRNKKNKGRNNNKQLIKLLN